MKRQLNLSIICALLFLSTSILCGCRSIKYVDREIPVKIVERDSIVINDTIIQTKLDVFHDSITVKDSSYLDNKYSYSFAVVDDNGLHHSLGIKDGANEESKVKTHTIVKYIERPVEISTPVEVYKLTLWQSIKCKTWWVLLIVSFFSSLTIFLLIKFK